MAQNINKSYEEMRAAILTGLNLEYAMEIEAKNAITMILQKKEVAGHIREGLKAYILGMISKRGLPQAIDLLEVDDIFDVEISCDLIAIRSILEESIAAKEELMLLLGVPIVV